jgi:hypothetical protein
MELNRMSRRALLGAGAVTLLGPALLAQEGHAALPTSVPTFTGHTAVKQAMLSKFSGIYNVADIGTVSTLLLVVDGVATEVQARRAGTYLPKNPGATSPKIVSATRYDQLLRLTGGVDFSATTTQQKAAFAALLNSATGTTTAPVTATCPPDFATMKPIEQLTIKNNLNLPQNQKYAPCFGPLTSADPLRELFGATEAHAVGDTLVFLRISSDDFFSQWTVSYDTSAGFYGFNLFGIRAIWTIG